MECTDLNKKLITTTITRMSAGYNKKQIPRHEKDKDNKKYIKKLIRQCTLILTRN